MSFHDDQPTGQTPEDGSLAASRADSSAHALSVQKKPYKTITTPTVEQVLSGLKGPRPSTLSQGSFGTLDPKEENTLFLYIQSNLSQESFDFDSVEGECREFLEGLSSLPPLGRVRVVTERLWRGRSVYMVQVAELLAVNSRDVSRRGPYGQAGILGFFLEIIALEDGVDDDVLLHSLRVVGNSCADTDENRTIVVESNSTVAIIRHFLNPKLVTVAVPVLYNICMDFEPAQAQVAANNLTYILLKLINDGVLTDQALLELSFELIEMASAAENVVESSLDGTIALLMDPAVKNDVEFSRYACLVNCLTTYLQKKRFQDLTVSSGMVENLLAVLDRSSSITVNTSSPEEVKALAQLRLKLHQALAEVSASSDFLEYYPLDSELSRTLTSWLTTGDDERQICACLTLGNLARSDEVCLVMVRDLKLHKPLVKILQNSSSGARGAVLHAALGFLKNLAIVAEDRTELGRAGVIPAISGLWSLETAPQVQFAAVSLARQVIGGCFENVARLLESTTTASSTTTTTTAVPLDVSRTTYLSLLLSLFEKTDAVPIQTEIGRTVASICRTIIRPDSATGDFVGDEAETTIDTHTHTLAGRFFSLHKDQGVARPLGAMVCQTQWPVVRSEGLFALALMASTKDGSGSRAVVDCLEHRVEMYQLLEEVMLTSQESELESGGGGVQSAKDRENTMVLVKKLLENEAESLPSSWKSTMEQALNERFRGMGMSS